jgi:glyoxylase-like metal-dependent hydrolase (beta-lactamase superfamily II)
MDIGAIQVLPVLDGSARFDAAKMFAGLSTLPGLGNREEDWLPHKELLADDGRLELAFGAYVVRSGDRIMLVDAGMGPHPKMPGSGGGLLDSLAAHGIAAGDVTDVVYTHLHGDHIGWASDGGEVVFVNAVHRCHRLDWEHFVGTDDGATEKLTPVEPLLELFDADVTLAPGVDVRLAPGHTPGSVLVVLSSGVARALLVGDVVHCPVELVDDEWGALADVDPALARQTRIALARELEGSDVPIGAAHFPGLAFGRLLAGEGRRMWSVD